MVILEIWAHCLPKHYGVLLERKKGSGGGWRWGKGQLQVSQYTVSKTEIQNRKYTIFTCYKA